MNKNEKIALGVTGVVVGVGAIVLATRNAGASGGGGTGKVTQIKGSITGELTTPIPGAAVSIAGYQAVTDGAGYYSIAVDLVPQDTTITVQASGYDDYTASVTLVAGVNTVSVDMTATSQETASLSGHITDASGNAINGATVTLSLNGQSIYRTTDSTGFYQVLQLLVGATVSWDVSKTGYVSKTGSITFVDGVNPLDVSLTAVVVDNYGPAFSFGTPTGSVYQDINTFGPVFIPRISVRITNNSGQVARHKIGVYCNYYAQPYSNTILYSNYYCGGSETYLLLNPGESVQFNYDAAQSVGHPGGFAALYQNFADFFVMDESGNKSGTMRLTG